MPTDPATIVATYSATLHAHVAALMCDLADVLNARTPKHPADHDALLRGIVNAADLIDNGISDVRRLEAFAATVEEITTTRYGVEYSGEGWTVRSVRAEGDDWRVRVDTTDDLTSEAAPKLTAAISAALNDIKDPG